MNENLKPSSFPIFIFCVVFALIHLSCFGLATGGNFQEMVTPTPTVTPFPDIDSGSLGFSQTKSAPLTGIVEFDGHDLNSNILVASPPAGFTSPKFSFGSIPVHVGSDGKGLQINLSPGQGTLLICLNPFEVNGLARISGTFWSDSQSLTVAVVALNSPIDGQIGYSSITGPEIGTNQYRTINLVYAPPSGKLNLGIQVVNMPFSSLSGTVYIDNLRVETLSPRIGNPVMLTVPGDFESNLEELKINYNNADGKVIHFFESVTNAALKLSINPWQTAANFGTLATGLENAFPFSLLGEISVKRETPPGGGMTGFVMTNGYQNVAVFRNTDEIPDLTTNLYEKIIIGGDFGVSNPDIPINLIVQNGGPGVSATIIADDLKLRKYDSFKPIPPTPTPVPAGHSITIPLDLPEGAIPLEMVLIPSGSFMMGSYDTEVGRFDDEGPRHGVTITKPFYLGKFEITQAQWEAVMGENWSHNLGMNLPMDSLSWHDAQLFIKEMNLRGNGKFRLPSEAEWEYACRAGTETRFYWGIDPENTVINDYAWYTSNSSSKSQVVGSKLPNPWNLFDMNGNVWEWCQDWYGPYSPEDQIDPQGPSSGDLKILRGSFWDYDSPFCRSAYRYQYSPTRRSISVGFRLVRDL